MCTDDPRNVNVEDKLKCLYLNSEYLEPTFIATALLDSFCDVKVYHKDFQKILSKVAEVRHHWITTHNTSFAEGQIRDFVEEILPFFDNKIPINCSLFKGKLKQIIRKEFEQYLDYPFDDIDDTMRVISKTGSII